MKLALVLILVSFSALADCPNLAGKYATCRSESGEVTAGSVVTQDVPPGMVYRNQVTPVVVPLTALSSSGFAPDRFDQ